MALTKANFNLLGFNTDVYVKIGGILMRETGSDEEGKLYSIEAQVDYFTNDTKQYQFKQETKSFTGLRLQELSLETAYSELANLEEFKTFTSVI